MLVRSSSAGEGVAAAGERPPSCTPSWKCTGLREAHDRACEVVLSRTHIQSAVAKDTIGSLRILSLNALLKRGLRLSPYPPPSPRAAGQAASRPPHGSRSLPPGRPSAAGP